MILIIHIIYFRKKSGEVDVPMIIGNNNLFEFHSHCESKIVGSENVFESKSEYTQEFILCIDTTQCPEEKQ